MLTPIEADHHLAQLLVAANTLSTASHAPHWSHDSGACFALMAKEACYPFMVISDGAGTTITIAGTGQPFTLRTTIASVEAAVRYSIVMAVIHKLELAGLRAVRKPPAPNDHDRSASVAEATTAGDPLTSLSAASAVALCERLTRSTGQELIA